MIPCGSLAQEIPPIAADHLFFERLKLLIIMTKACLQGYPLGDCRAKAIAQNADFIFYQSLYRVGRKQDPHLAEEKDGGALLLYQRTQLLAAMALCAARGDLAGGCRHKAVADNITRICDHLREQFHLTDAPFLKVA
jgi:hypothetical protein